MRYLMRLNAEIGTAKQADVKRLFAEATKAKELRDLSLTVAEWAKRKGMGEDAIQHCRAYALDAERRLGELLTQTELQGPGQYQQRLHDDTVAPTLTEMGLSKRDSAQSKKLFAVPEEVYEKIRAGEKTRT
jgi:hypothetical protein